MTCWSAAGPDFYELSTLPVRLLFQCRYSAKAAEALVMDVYDLPPPVSVTASGPLRVELRLGKGECNRKGCLEGEVV